MTDVKDRQTYINRVKNWASALESGEYTQGTGSMKTLEGFCCLGVACDLFDHLGWRRDGQNYSYTDGIDECEGILPPNVVNWLGIYELQDQPYKELGTGKDPDPEVPVRLVSRITDDDKWRETSNYFVALSKLNDELVPFEYIAEIIRAYWVRGEMQ